jgi:tetratricopeptide (TPR) repeat protein
LAELALQRGDQEQAIALYRRAIEDSLARGDQPKLALYRQALGAIQIALGDLTAGRENLEESLLLAEEIGWLNGVCTAALALAPLSIADGDLVAARQYAQRAHDGFRRLGMENEQQNAVRLLDQLG